MSCNPLLLPVAITIMKSIKQRSKSTNPQAIKIIISPNSENEPAVYSFNTADNMRLLNLKNKLVIKNY